MSRRLAVLHHPLSFFAPDLRAAIDHDVELMWVLPDWPADQELSARLLSRLGEVVHVCGADLDGAAAALQDLGADGLITFVDDHIVLAAELGERLGLPYHRPNVARALVNKVSQRRILDAAGVAGPRFWVLEPGLCPARLAERADEISYPAVLKPAYGSGSRGIVSVADSAQLRAVYDPAAEQIVEAYLADDPQREGAFASSVSVESVVVNGSADHLAITGRFPLAPPFRETGNVVPAAVEPELHADLFELTDRALAALGVGDGITHTEIKLTPDGLRLIEINGRLGGRPPFVLRQVSDVNLFQIASDIALRRPVTTSGLVQCDGVGYWLMLHPPCWATRMDSIEGLDELARLGHVASVTLSRRPGSPVSWTEGTAAHVVTVRGRTRDHAGLVAAISEINQTVVIGYEAESATAADATLAVALA